MTTRTTGTTTSARHQQARRRLAALAIGAGPNGYSRTYVAAVGEVATILRPRLEAGELRGWLEGDEKLFPRPFGAKPSDADPPLWRIETACTKLFITTPEAALMVLRCSPKRSHREAWRWDDASAGGCLLSAAQAAMATDVLQLARARGWSKPRRGERPAAARPVRNRA